MATASREKAEADRDAARQALVISNRDRDAALGRRRELEKDIEKRKDELAFRNGDVSRLRGDLRVAVTGIKKVMGERDEARNLSMNLRAEVNRLKGMADNRQELEDRVKILTEQAEVDRQTIQRLRTEARSARFALRSTAARNIDMAFRSVTEDRLYRGMLNAQNIAGSRYVGEMVGQLNQVMTEVAGRLTRLANRLNAEKASRNFDEQVGHLSDIQHEIRGVTYGATRDVVGPDGAPHVSPQDEETNGAEGYELAGESDGELTLEEGLVVPVVGCGATGGVSPRRDAAN